MNWNHLHRILSGIIGASILIISLASPVAKLAMMGIGIQYYLNNLYGSVLIITSFILSRIFIPEIMIDFDTPTKYADKIVDRHKDKTLIIHDEFSDIEKILLNSSSKKYVKFKTAKEFLPISIGIASLGELEFIYKFSVIKYEIYNCSRPFVRLLIWILITIGMLFVYYHTLDAVYYLIEYQLKSIQ